MNGLSAGVSVVNGYGSAVPIYRPNSSYAVWWDVANNPFQLSGPVNLTSAHTVCIASNVTINRLCCEEQNGTFVDFNALNNKGESTGQKAESVSAADKPNWCELTGPNYTDHYASQPESVTKFSQCFDRVAVPSHNPGQYSSNVTADSAVYMCQGSGAFQGVSVWGLPSLAAAPASRAATRAVMSLIGLGVSAVAVAAISSVRESRQALFFVLML